MKRLLILIFCICIISSTYCQELNKLPNKFYVKESHLEGFINSTPGDTLRYNTTIFSNEDVILYKYTKKGGLITINAKLSKYNSNFFLTKRLDNKFVGRFYDKIHSAIYELKYIEEQHQYVFFKVILAKLE